jgi:hypothetical protein
MNITHLTLLLLFPGFFFYQTLLGLGKIGALLGGYFSEITVLLFLPLLLFYGKKIRQNAKLFTKTDLYFAIFIAYFIIIIAANFFSGANIAIIQAHSRSIAYYLTLFITFKFMDLNSSLFKPFIIFNFIAMSAIIFLFSVDGTFYLASQNLAKDSENVASYQGFSRSYFIVSIVIISFIKSLEVRVLIYCLAVSALYVNGARSEFVALLFMLPIIEIYRSKNKLNTLIFIGVFVGIVALNFALIISLLPTNRMLELIDLSQSTSANARNYLNAQALNTIFSNPVFGDYGSYAPGDYAHNLLSAWVDLGIFGFFYLLMLLIIPDLFLISDGFLHNKISDDFLLAFCLISTTIFLLSTSHGFNDMTTGAALGAYANYRSGRGR